MHLVTQTKAKKISFKTDNLG